MKIRVLLFVVACLSLSTQAQDNDSIIAAIDQAIMQRDFYVKQKHEELKVLEKIAHKSLLSDSLVDIQKSYIDLYEGYKAFRYDTAYYYLEKAKNIAFRLKDSSLISEAKIREGFILISAGLFTEALDTLNSINPSHLDSSGKYHYFYNRARAYFDLADYNDDTRFAINYLRKGIFNLQEALKNVNENSGEYLKASGLKALKQQDWRQAKSIYLQWLNQELPPQLFGVATSSLSYVYSQLDNHEKAMEYLTMAAISDLENAIQENTALRNLAIALYEDGSLNKANQYVRVAFQDAELYNARQRRNQISAFLPIIESAQLYKVEQKNKSLQNIVLLLTALAIIVLVFLGIIIKQLRDKKAVRRALSENNEMLRQMNFSLTEADAIKQDYITYFLKATSELINKMGALQTHTVLKIRTKKPEEVLGIIQKYSAKKERDTLFHRFDEIFLQLFPGFIKQINELFPIGDQIVIKKGDLLSTELRIYALYRLGIQDNKQIAEFLDISVATVYSYKTRLKSKSTYRDDFEDRIMDIKRL